MIDAMRDSITAFLAGEAAAGTWPGATFAVGTARQRPVVGAVGRLALEPAEEPARADALYDLASLTKGLVTAPLVLRLASRGAVDPDAPLDALLPEWRDAGRAAPSFADLLLHRAGLPAWAPLYRLASGPGEAAAQIARRPPPPGDGPVYSCLGPIAAGLALERAAGRSLRALFTEEIAAPLGLDLRDAAWSPLPRDAQSRVAPTERGRRYEQRMADAEAPRDAEKGRATAPGPDRILRGEVHDGNAAFLGGAAGNAGLFASAGGVFAIAAALLEPGRLLDRPALGRLARAHGSRGDVRTFGFQSGAAECAPAGPFGPRSFGHVGFTGTSVWLDPGTGAIAVLLTNRVHPVWREAPMQERRRAFHALAASPAGRTG